MVEKTSKDLNEDLEELANVYQEDSKDTYLSVYLDLKDKARMDFFDKRVRIIRNVVKKDKMELANFDKAVDAARDELKVNHDHEAKAVALFISKSPDYFKRIFLPVETGNLIVLDTSPYIRPLALIEDEYRDYVLVLVDSEHFKIYDMAATTIESKGSKSTELIGKHKKGGWSQQRFSRLRKEAVDKFHKNCAEDLVKIMRETDQEGIVLAGPGKAKEDFAKHLPQDIVSEIVARLDVSMDLHQSKLIQMAEGEMAAAEKAEGDELSKMLKDAVMAGKNVTYGLEETLEATQQGRVSILLVDTDTQIPGYICEKDQHIGKGSPKPCPICGGETSEVDVIEEIIEFAIRMGSRVEFVKGNDYLKELGCIAAYLRY